MNAKIAFTVLFIHCVAIVCLSFDPPANAKLRRTGPIKVSTFRIPPPPIAAKTSASAPKSAAPNKAAPAPKKTTVAPKAKSTEPPKKALPPKKDLRAIEESLAKIAEIPASKSIDLKLPTPIAATQIQPTVEELPQHSEYAPLLAELLHCALGPLPELGNVRVCLTLEKPGHIIWIDVLDSESEKNAAWLKKQLPLLELPCFNDFGITDSQLKFTILFRNEDPV